jgi:L-asparaginase
MNLSTLRLITTGGTIAKWYNPLRGALDFDAGAIDKLLAEGLCTRDFEIQAVSLVDSLDMTEDQRAALVEACVRAPEPRLLVTHGTDTLVRSAQAIAAAVENKTVVLTGAMVPFQVGRSDAPFNMGAALMAARLAPVGVWVVMNGQLFAANNVQKNYDEGIFEPLS